MEKEKKNRDCEFKFRLTSEERKQLREMAKQSGLKESSYIRCKLFHGEAATINAVEFLKTYKQQIYEMDKIGNNINQLAHYANICILNNKLDPLVIEEMNGLLGQLINVERTISSINKTINSRS